MDNLARYNTEPIISDNFKITQPETGFRHISSRVPMKAKMFCEKCFLFIVCKHILCPLHRQFSFMFSIIFWLLRLIKLDKYFKNNYQNCVLQALFLLSKKKKTLERNLLHYLQLKLMPLELTVYSNVKFLCVLETSKVRSIKHFVL